MIFVANTILGLFFARAAGTSNTRNSSRDLDGDKVSGIPKKMCVMAVLMLGAAAYKIYSFAVLGERQYTFRGPPCEDEVLFPQTIMYLLCCIFLVHHHAPSLKLYREAAKENGVNLWKLDLGKQEPSDFGNMFRRKSSVNWNFPAAWMDKGGGKVYPRSSPMTSQLPERVNNNRDTPKPSETKTFFPPPPPPPDSPGTAEETKKKQGGHIIKNRKRGSAILIQKMWKEKVEDKMEKDRLEFNANLEEGEEPLEKGQVWAKRRICELCSKKYLSLSGDQNACPKCRPPKVKVKVKVKVKGEGSKKKKKKKKTEDKDKDRQTELENFIEETKRRQEEEEDEIESDSEEAEEAEDDTEEKAPL